MNQVTVATTQMSCTDEIDKNMAKAEQLVRQAAEQGAQIILLPELFATRYFCQKKKPGYSSYASSLANNRVIQHFQTLARQLQVVLPISFYEQSNNGFFNSVAVIDADGQVLGIYRKSHIPDGPGYEEKYYFRPGDTGFRVWQTRYAQIGIGICWDQWFPEAARCMALLGAELLFYLSAIGSEPEDPTIDSKDHWQACMLGHAAANMVPVIAANRVGVERDEDSTITFYGSSFIAGPHGDKWGELNRTEESTLTATFDLDQIKKQRDEWGLFRDRRPDLYGVITKTF
jgi:N-carbamoylputrescine amidase